MKAIRKFFSANSAPLQPAEAGLVFLFLWAILFAIYWPARHAGFITDFTGWLDQVKNHSFAEYINRTNFGARSWYQVTQFNTWVGYKLFGIHSMAWHLLFVSMHAVNAALLFLLVCRLLLGSGVSGARCVAFWGAVLYCVTPYVSEAVVWEPAFHFLQGMLLILLVLLCAQRYIHTSKTTWAFAAIALYGVSLFTLEVFYLTPWLVLSLVIFYRGSNMIIRQRSWVMVKLLFLPMLALFVLRFAAYRALNGEWVSRIGTGQVEAMKFYWLGKPAKYLFHLLLLGRFWSPGLRDSIYSWCDGVPGIVLFYAGALSAIAIAVARFRGMAGKSRVAALLLLWLVMALLLLVPLWFASDMLVVYDRYTYFAGGFFYMLFAVVAAMLGWGVLRCIVIALFVAVNMRYAVKVSRYWGKSERVVTSLVRNIPADNSKIILLLNIPQNMCGVPMIGAEKNSEYKLMHDLLEPGKLLTGTVYDVLAYNMLTPWDGAHVHVINDSLVKVTLNQWGTWWWFETRGGYSYWTADYKLDLKDPGHWYELTLRKPASQYQLLYNVGDQWKQVDMSRKNVEQD